MKNFVRALRYCLPYRSRLIISVVCAVMAAVLWGLNFRAIYPVLKILGTGQNMQEWVEECITDTQKIIDPLEESKRQLDARKKELERLPPGKEHDKQDRNLSSQQASLESKLESAYSEKNRYEQAKKYINLLPRDSFKTLALLIGLVVLAVAVKGPFEFFQESLVGSVINLSLYDLRNRFYRNAIHLDVNQFGEQGTSELMARFTNDTEMLGAGLKVLLGKMIAEPLRALSCIIFACFISWQLTFMFLILVPVALFVLTKVGRIMKRASRRLLERMSSIYKILQETFQGIRIVKAFTMEPYERRRFRNATKDYYHKSMQVVKLDAFADPVIQFLGGAAMAGAFLVGAYMVLGKRTELLGIPMQPLQAESLLTFYMSLVAIADPVRKLASVYTKLQSGAAASDRIFAFMDREPRVRRNFDGPHLDRHHAAIEFRDVCFSYDPGRPILTNLHLHIRFGETVAVVGANGSGKTTLVGLIPRFYDPDHGSILIDGLPIRKVNLRSLRQQIGLVTQETVLFDDTIGNNIAYGNRKAKREEVEAAAERAFAHDFIMRLSNGYDTLVGEAGAKLSGGQKQRIALARAILRDPSILILDEFTSQYDAESEALIHRALREFIHNRTTIVITHRLNTLEIADRIIVLDNGRIGAVGTHQELLASCPAYQRLHEAQFQRLCA